MTQGASCYEDLSVKENISYFASISGSKEIDRILGIVELKPISNRLVSLCSGGEKARVALGCALIGNPSLLVLDEPTVGLDPLLRNELWTFFHDLTTSGVTILLSSHVMDEASRCDQLSFLRDGKVLASGSVNEIIQTTATNDLESAFIKLSEKEK